MVVISGQDVEGLDVVDVVVFAIRDGEMAVKKWSFVRTSVEVVTGG